MDDSTKTQALARLRRISGQLEGVARMVEQDRSCVDLLVQLASAQGALGQVGRLILRSHVESSVPDIVAASKANERKQRLDELMQVFARYGCLGCRPDN